MTTLWDDLGPLKQALLCLSKRTDRPIVKTKATIPQIPPVTIVIKTIQLNLPFQKSIPR